MNGVVGAGQTNPALRVEGEALCRAIWDDDVLRIPFRLV